MVDTLVFIDDGFLSKLSKYLGDGKYLKFHRKDFAEFISKKEGLNCKKVFIYTAPPFQSHDPNSLELKRKEGYDIFKNSLLKEGIILREGRCQRLKLGKGFSYKQKAVDILLVIDLMNIHLDYPKIKRIILVCSDSDFVPVIKNLEEKGIKTILYTYYSKERNTNFSRSNYLIQSVHKYVLLSKKDFDDAPLNK